MEDIFLTLLSSSSLCSESGVLKSFRFIGYILFIIKILVPIILIIMGSINFGKAVLASNSDGVKKAGITFATQIVSAVVIFLIPTIVNFVFDLLPSDASSYQNCTTCLFDPNACEINN